MANGPYSSVMIIAGDGMVQNQGIDVNGNLTLVINDYLGTNAISSFQSVWTNAEAAGNTLTSNTLANLASIGSNSFPALTDSIPPTLVANISTVYGNTVANVYGNTVYTFTDLITAQADRLIGNTGNGPDLSILAQVYGISQGYRITTNQLLNSVKNIDSLELTFTGMDDLTTGGISQVSDDLPKFGAGIQKLGTTIDLSRLNYFGHPWVLLLQIITQSGLLPAVYFALVNSGVTDDEIVQIQSAPLGVAASLDKKIYQALKTIKGADLAELKTLLDVTTPGLQTAADLLNPVLMLPDSYKTLITLLPSGYIPSATNTSSAPWYEFSSSWSKASTLTSLDRNWGLYRCWFGSNPDSTWGYDGAITSEVGTVTLSASGKNVDVIVVDAVIDPNHPELAVRADGSGGSRVKYFNWYSLNIPGDPSYGNVYNPPITTNAADSADDSRHATHVAGIVAGNTQGWASNANIYNISPQYVTGGVQYTYLYKYILAWHKAKVAAGNTTPTIVNNSWYSRYTIPYTSITAVTYRGTSYTGSFTKPQLLGYGITVNDDDDAIVALQNSTMDADIQACIDAGIIMVACAGNDDTRISVSGDTDYNNTLTATGFNGGSPIYYTRGSSPGATSNVICVGSIGAGVSGGGDRKSGISNCGPRVNLFAPGSYIASSWLTSSQPTGTGYPNPVPDPRNPAYYIAKDSGTSMASPQVCGILACALELNPTLNQTSALTYITEAANANQIPDSGGGYADPYSLQGAPNLYLDVPQQLFVTPAPSPVVRVPVYNASGAINSTISQFYRLDPSYLELSTIVPPEQAAGSLAWARSMAQVKGISNLKLPVFSDTVLAVETNTGLADINALTTPIPTPIKQNLVEYVGTGTGTGGTLTVYDFMGTLAGYPYIDQFPIVTGNIVTLQQIANLSPLLDASTGIYAYMNNTLAGDYNDPMSPPTVIIPSGPAAGTYGNIDIAFSTGLIPAAEVIVGNIANSYPTQVTNTNAAEAPMVSQINTENLNLKLAQVKFAELTSNSAPAVISLASSLHEIGTDVSEYGPNQFFTAIADTQVLAGQAIVASLREGRNIALLNDAGVGTDTQLNPN